MKYDDQIGGVSILCTGSQPTYHYSIDLNFSNCGIDNDKLSVDRVSICENNDWSFDHPATRQNGYIAGCVAFYVVIVQYIKDQINVRMSLKQI